MGQLWTFLTHLHSLAGYYYYHFRCSSDHPRLLPPNLWFIRVSYLSY